MASVVRARAGPAPVAHKIYGIALTINCANFVYFLALEKLLELKNPAVVEIYACSLAPVPVVAPPLPDQRERERSRAPWRRTHGAPDALWQPSCATCTVARAWTSTGARPTPAPPRPSTSR